jgi:hypothetical protein
MERRRELANSTSVRQERGAVGASTNVPFCSYSLPFVPFHYHCAFASVSYSTDRRDCLSTPCPPPKLVFFLLRMYVKYIICVFRIVVVGLRSQSGSFSFRVQQSWGSAQPNPFPSRWVTSSRGGWMVLAGNLRCGSSGSVG